MIDEPSCSACHRILANNWELFRETPGSSHNHQNWPGGYFDHIREVMNIAVALYGFLSSIRPLPFSLSDLLLVLFLHDIEKPWKYGHGLLLHTKKERHEFRMKKLAEYSVVLTPDQENGMYYVEGEGEDYSNTQRVMGSLACVAHMCDIASARLWFDHPAVDDTWCGAKRVNVVRG